MNNTFKKKRLIIGIIISQLIYAHKAHSELLWEPFSNIGIQEDQVTSERNSNKNILQNGSDKSRFRVSTGIEGIENKGFIIWEKVKEKKINSKLIWKSARSNQAIFNPTQKRRYSIPSTFEEAVMAYKSIKPSNSDYLPILRLSPAFPTTNTLKEEDTEIRTYKISSFNSGSNNDGTGNQNYAFSFKYGLSDRIQFTAIYSIADDPLFSKINSLSSQPENYWESLASVFKFKLLEKDNVSLGLESSIEAWNVGSGGPNIFNKSENRVFSRNIIGTISLPIDIKVTKKFSLSGFSGISFLPPKQGKNWGVEGDFYGKNIYMGTGFSWEPSNNINLIGSILSPVGPGFNSFNNDLIYKRNTIYNFGMDLDLNPRIGIQARLTNGFGATPATGILTIPSSNKPLYYGGFKYTHGAKDSPQRNFNKRERGLSLGGITVNTALIPPEGTTHIWGNIDSKENTFGYFGHSLSNIFNLDIINLGNHKSIDSRTGKKGDLVNNYMNDGGINTRFGGKFILLSPLRDNPTWLASRISFGRNQDTNQGYLFAEIINSWEPTKWLAVSLNPKIAWSGIASPFGIGIGANIQLSKKAQIIPEVNIALSKYSENNSTLAIRWLFSENINIDFYISSASSLLDIGQLLSSDESRLGTKLHITY